ncbi:MAG: segregation/condensation protein A [Halobacteriales archaeon]
MAATPKATQQPTEPVDVLVDMAREGEIDPWDIDVVRVTDKFLERLDEGDLARTGRAILYASILVRMKSDYVVEGEVEDDDVEEPWGFETRGPEVEPAVEYDDGVVDDLEREFERRLRRRRVRGRTKPETLDELIRELRERERGSWWKEGREYDTSGSVEPPSFEDYYPEPTTEDAMQAAHEDDIESRVEEVWRDLEPTFEEREEVLFQELLPACPSRRLFATTFVALSFLASRGDVYLDQDELFGDLWVRRT